MSDPENLSPQPSADVVDEELLGSFASFLKTCSAKSESLGGLDLDSETAFPSHLTLNGVQMAGGFLYGLLKSYMAALIEMDPEVVEGLKVFDWSGLSAGLESLEVSDEIHLESVLPRMEEVYRELMRLLNKAIEHQDAVELIRRTWPKLKGLE